MKLSKSIRLHLLGRDPNKVFLTTVNVDQIKQPSRKAPKYYKQLNKAYRKGVINFNQDGEVWITSFGYDYLKENTSDLPI